MVRTVLVLCNGEQPRRALGVQLDQLQPGADVQQMGAVDLDTPLVVHPLHRWRLEAEINERIDEKIHQINVVGLVDPSAHVEHAVEGRRLDWRTLHH